MVIPTGPGRWAFRAAAVDFPVDVVYTWVDGADPPGVRAGTPPWPPTLGGRRSVVAEIERAWPDEVLATASHQVRHHEDVSLMASLQQHWSMLTGPGVVSELRYLYTDLSDPTAPETLAGALRTRNLDAFCLNDKQAEGEAAARQAALLAGFLPSFLPFRSPYELPEPAEAATPTPSAASAAAASAVGGLAVVDG